MIGLRSRLPGMPSLLQMLPLLLVLFAAAALPSFVAANIHTLEVTEDDRASIVVSSFGLVDRGVINITLLNFKFESDENIAPAAVGFRVVLTSTYSATIDELYTLDGGCPLAEPETIAKNTVRLILSQNSSEFVSIHRGEHARVGVIFSDINGEELGTLQPTEDDLTPLPLGVASISIIATPDTESMYHVYFHNCHNIAPSGTSATSVVSFSTRLEQYNIKGTDTKDFLSVGESVLPAVLFATASSFLFAFFIWLGFLITHKKDVYKIHYLMLVLVFLKACSSFSLAMKYNTIKTQGYADETWQIFYYIFRFIRTALFFVAISVLAAGFTYIKSYLSLREKKVILVVLILQILSNSANVIYDEEEEGDKMYTQWRQLNKIVNVISCGIVLVVTMWSINHLKDASGTSGKAARALSKLKLFSSFFTMLFVYVFYVEFFVDLLRSSLPFRHEWIAKFMEDVGMLCFFVFIGYKFRPGSDNPYLQVPQEDEDEEIPMDEVVNNSGANVGATLVSRSSASSV